MTSAPLSVAFAGQRSLVEPHLLREPSDGVTPSFHDLRDGSDFATVLGAIEEQRPDVVVVFRPDLVPPGGTAGLDAIVLGVAPDPLPRKGRSSHASLDYNLAMLQRSDAGSFDRVILTDPLGWDTVSEALPLWRCMPLPVDDALFRDPTPSRHPPRLAFIGHSTVHRETMLVEQKHKFDLPHYAHALLGEELKEVLAATDVAVCVHNDEDVITFPPVLLVHLAAGHLAISEPLDPPFGLEPGIHYVQVGSRHDLDLRLHQIHENPGAYDRVRIRGNHFAQQFRASRTWPRILRDLVEDVRVFGSERTRARAAQ